MQALILSLVLYLILGISYFGWGKALHQFSEYKE